MTTYPTPRPVPESVRRPDYVPKNFFSAPWGEHDHPQIGEDRSDDRIRLGGEDELLLRRAGTMVAEILREVGRLVKVVDLREKAMRCFAEDEPSPVSRLRTWTRLYMR